MTTIKFKFKPAEKNHASSYARGWIVLGPHGIDEEGDHHLSPECVTLREVEESIKFLQRELDQVLNKARGKFKKSN